MRTGAGAERESGWLGGCATEVLIEAATGLGLIAETDEVAPGRPVTVTWLPPAATGPA